ncbi:MAG: tetratricopeptide repeat protein [Candidatus Omnitrophica bacterium]|nr:tetratricopeptide repeat protein [Candidatus Omnitrophota bacterium]
MKTVFNLFVTFAIVGCVFWQCASLQAEYRQARLRAFMEVAPNAFDDIVAAVEANKPLDQRRVKAYLNYAHALIHMEPQKPDAWGLAGFCYAQLNDYPAAIDAYTKAINQVPQFFGFHYNLAVVYFKAKQYDKSLEEAQKVMTSDPQSSLMFILISKRLYALIMETKAERYALAVEAQIKRVYEQAYQLMVANQYCLTTGQSFADQSLIRLESF